MTHALPDHLEGTSRTTESATEVLADNPQGPKRHHTGARRTRSTALVAGIRLPVVPGGKSRQCVWMAFRCPVLFMVLAESWHCRWVASKCTVDLGQSEGVSSDTACTNEGGCPTLLERLIWTVIGQLLLDCWSERPTRDGRTRKPNICR